MTDRPILVKTVGTACGASTVAERSTSGRRIQLTFGRVTKTSRESRQSSTRASLCRSCVPGSCSLR